MKAMTIVDRAILWNKQRYDQEYNYELAVSLILEETEELMNAKNAIESMDAVGDIFFVAIGIFWKLGLPTEYIQAIFHEIDLTKATMNECYEWCNNIELSIMDYVENIPGSYPAIKLTCFCCFISAMGAIRALNLQHTIYDIVHAICDSNHTKAIEGKTASNIKANINKGNSFIPPKKALQTIYKNNKIIH